jgi:hypothetical protein
MQLTKKQITAIENFLNTHGKNPCINLVSTVIENPKCGIYLADWDGNIKDIECLAVTATPEERWTILRKNCKIEVYEQQDAYCHIL